MFVGTDIRNKTKFGGVMWDDDLKPGKIRRRIQVLDFTTYCCSMNMPKTYGFLEIIYFHNIIYGLCRFLFSCATDYNVVV